MNYAKKLGQKMVKSRAAAHAKTPSGLRADFASTKSPGGVTRLGGLSRVPKSSGGGYNGPWQGASSGPAAPGSSKGFGAGYKQTYAESHIHGKPRQSLRRYRRNKRIQAEYANARVT